MRSECAQPGCNRFLGYNMEKTGIAAYCKGCNNFTHFKEDGSKRIYHKEFLPEHIKISYQDKLQKSLVKK